MNLYNWLVIVFVFASGTASMANAGVPRANSPHFLDNAGDMKWGPLQFYPSIQAFAGYDDNIFSSNDNTQDSVVTRIVPELGMVLTGDSSTLKLGYQADAIQYEQSSDDDFTDHLFYLIEELRVGYRHRFDVDIRHEQTHEERGAGLSEGFDPVNNVILNTPNAYTDISADIRYTYGAPTAKGNVRLDLNGLDRHYTNNRDLTFNYDREEVGAGATFLWRAFPKTALALEGRTNYIRYPYEFNDRPPLDSREDTILIGAEWEASGNTSGVARIGQKTKNFDTDERDDVSGIVWEISATWTPRPYSELVMEFERNPRETNGTGNFIDAKTATIGWNHEWMERFQTNVSVLREQLGYSEADRVDDVSGYRLGAGYEMRRWLTFRLDAEWREKLSDVDSLEFTRNRYWLSALITL